MSQLRVLVVDESAAFRALLADCLGAAGAARVVANARDGKDAIAKAETYKPDVVTLDLGLTDGSGLETLRDLRAKLPATPVVVLTAQQGTSKALGVRALELGAYDFVSKPAGASAAERDELSARLGAVLGAIQAPRRPSIAPPGPPKRVAPPCAPEIVGIGASTGGPTALQRIVPALPRDLGVPVLLVQHMPPQFTSSLADTLAERSAIRVVEARHGDVLKAGTVYVAPGGAHLKVAASGGARRVELSDDPPENFCRPAVDVLFRSLAAVYRERAMGVILTGMGRDGTAGLRAMKAHGVKVVGQSAESCTVYGMPREAMAAGVVDVELPAEKIARAIVDAVAGRTIG
jgi:two-component system chemotaxis response regulator CheB